MSKKVYFIFCIIMFARLSAEDQGLSYYLELGFKLESDKKTSLKAKLVCQYKEQNKRLQESLKFTNNGNYKFVGTYLHDIENIQLEATYIKTEKSWQGYVKTNPILHRKENDTKAILTSAAVNTAIKASAMLVTKEIESRFDPYTTKEDYYIEQIEKKLVQADVLIEQASKKLSSLTQEDNNA